MCNTDFFVLWTVSPLSVNIVCVNIDITELTQPNLWISPKSQSMLVQ